MSAAGALRVRKVAARLSARQSRLRRIAPRPNGDDAVALEREIKLGIDADAASSLLEHPLLGMLGGAPRRQWLRSRYFDLDDSRLAGAGLALRLRDDGSRHWLTLKAAGGDAFGHRRGEWEWPIDGDALSLPALQRALRETPLGALGLDAAALLDGLRPRLGTAFERCSWRVDWRGSTVEVALDRGSCQAWASGALREAPLCEVELELLDGDWSACWELAWALAQDIALPPSPINKAQRAAALAAGRLPAAPADAAPPAADAALGEALRAWLGGAAAQLAVWAERVRGSDDAHDVHQLRVVLRRLRTTLRWLRARASPRALSGFDAELRWTMQVAAPVRDADVSLPLLRAVGAAPAVVDALRREREVRLARLRAHLRGARFARLLLALARWSELDAADGSVRELAHDAVRAELRAWRAARRRAAAVLARGKVADDDEVRALHVLRIRCKRLRLACERFAGALPKPKRHAALARRCEKLQGLLGDWHDAERLRQQTAGRLDATSDAALRARAADALRAARALLGD